MKKTNLTMLGGAAVLAALALTGCSAEPKAHSVEDAQAVLSTDQWLVADETSDEHPTLLSLRVDEGWSERNGPDAKDVPVVHVFRRHCDGSAEEIIMGVLEGGVLHLASSRGDYSLGAPGTDIPVLATDAGAPVIAGHEFERHPAGSTPSASVTAFHEMCGEE